MKRLSGRPAKQPAAATRRRMSGEERKAQIVRVATALFAREGFRGATTREIARKAGISEAVIYKHFSRKEDLYKAIIDSRCADPEGEPRLLSMLKGKEGKDVFVIIASYLLEEHRRDSSFLRLLMYSALEQQSLSELFINTRGLEFLGFLESHIQSLIKKGSMRNIDPALAARAFIGMVEHYSIAQELYGAKSFFSRPELKVVETFVDIFLNGMKRR